MANKNQASRSRRESPTDIQKRAALMTAIQEHVVQLPGTQSEKAEALEITQPRLNDLLKDRVDKFSLDGLVALAAKAGLRVSLEVQPVQIHTGLGAVSLYQRDMLSIFAPAPNELGKLDPNMGTCVFLKLLRCEAIANGISMGDVVLSLNLNVKDGGIDAKVENSQASSSLLSKGNTYYQIKTGPSFKPWQPSSLRKELFGKSTAKPSKKLLGDEINNCLNQNGTYALVTFGHDLLPNQHSLAIKELKKLFEDCGYLNPKVCVYGQGQIVSELDKYPSICLDLIGLSDGGFLSIEGWRCNSQMQQALELGDTQKAFIQEVQAALLEGGVQHIRVIGEPGIGKTRLILESVTNEGIAPSVIYVPTGEEFQKSRLFNEILKPDRLYSATLIVDDCDNHNRASIWSALKGHKGIKLITIDHGPEETHDSAMKTFACPQLHDEQIKNILHGYLQNKTDLNNWVSWCSGSPRVAHAVGENLKSNPEDILKSPADVPIWDRFIIGHKEMDSREAEQHRVVLRHLALFHKFGFESPVSEEGRFISQLIQNIDPAITWGRFQVIVQHFRSKRILQGRHTLFIVPKALHVHLWVEFWINHGRGFEFQTFLKQVPTSMKGWFLQLFIYAHAADPAKDVVKDILSINGPFADQAFFKSEVGLRFVNYLAEADPSSTLALLERTIKTWSHEELHAWSTGRQDIVWALEKIVAWDEFFVRATDVLISMALTENASNSNNSKGLLLSLFGIGLGWAPTEAPPSKRLPILQSLVTSTDAAKRSLGIELCERWLKTHGGCRTIGAEYQGLKPPIKFWFPKTYGEVFGYWREVLRFIRNEMNGFDVDDRNHVAKVLVNAAKGLVQNNDLSEEIMDMLLEITKDKEINKGPITQFVIWELRQRKEKLDKKTLNRIRQLDKLLTGDSLWERTGRFVLHTNWDEDYMFKGDKYQELNLPSKRVQKLAKEYMGDFKVFTSHLSKLVREGGHRLPELGVECGKLATPDFDEALFTHIQSNSKDINPIYAGGYLAGIRIQDPARWEAWLHRLLLNTDTREIAVDCVIRSGFTESILRDMLTLFLDGKLSSKCFDRFAFSRNRNELGDALFQEIITKLIRNQDDSSVNICIHLIHDYYLDKESSGNFPEELTFEVLTSVHQSDNQDQMFDYYWNQIAERYLNKYPHRSIELLAAILNNFAQKAGYSYLDGTSKIANTTVANYPLEAWEIISKILISDESSSELTFWLGDNGFDENSRAAITFLPAEEIIDWVKENKEERQWLIYQMLPKTLDKDEGGQITRLFIDAFYDDDIIKSLFTHFHMGSWSGPESDYLSKKRDSARRWMSEISSLNIQLWLGQYIDYLSSCIESAQIKEERQF